MLVFSASNNDFATFQLQITFFGLFDGFYRFMCCCFGDACVKITEQGSNTLSNQTGHEATIESNVSGTSSLPKWKCIWKRDIFFGWLSWWQHAFLGKHTTYTNIFQARVRRHSIRFLNWLSPNRLNVFLNNICLLDCSYNKAKKRQRPLFKESLTGYKMKEQSRSAART